MVGMSLKGPAVGPGPLAVVSWRIPGSCIGFMKRAPHPLAMPVCVWLLLLIFILYWSIVDLQGCVSFQCAAK